MTLELSVASQRQTLPTHLKPGMRRSPCMEEALLRKTKPSPRSLEEALTSAQDTPLLNNKFFSDYSDI